MEQQRSSSLWAFMRKREAIMTTPSSAYSAAPGHTTASVFTTAAQGAYASRQSVDYAAWRQEAPPPAEVPPSWDPQACWLVSPEMPALPAAPAAAAASVSTAPFTAATHGFAAPPGSAAAGPGAPGTSGKPRTGFAGAWARLKQRFARSPRRGRGAAGGSDDRELLGAAAPIPTPGTATSSSSRQHSTLLHTTGSVPALPRQPQPPARRQSLAGQPSHIPKPPLPPSARRHSISTTPGPLPGSSSHSSSTPSSASRLLPPVFSSTSSSGVNGGFAPAPLAPSWQQQQGGRGLAHSAGAAAAATEAAGARGTPASDDGTARRLVFSPPPSRAERPATQPMPISSLYQRTEWYMQPSHRQQPPGGHPSLHQQQQQEQQQQQAAGQPAWPPRPGGTSASHGSGVPRLVTPRLSFECMAPAAGSAAAIGPPLPLADLLAVPPEMLGAWVTESEGGGGGGGGRASVHALLQLPALQAAVWEQMQELQVSESDGKLVLVWTTRVGGAGVLRRPEEAYPTNGALATVPRMDGRGGGAAAQMAVSIDGTLSIKSLQGPPLPAIIHQKFRLSASGGRLRISLKAQLLDDEGEGLGTRRTSLCTISRSAGAKYATTWRRLHA